MNAVKEIGMACAEVFDISADDLFGTRRFSHLTLPRQLAMWMARNRTELSLPVIGRLMGRDHTTILHGVQKIEEMVNDPARADIKAAIRSVEAVLSGAATAQEREAMELAETIGEVGRVLGELMEGQGEYKRRKILRAMRVLYG